MSKQRDLEYERRNLIQLSNNESKLVRILANMLSTLFVGDIFLGFLSGFNPTPNNVWIFLQITIVIYFWSWFLAAVKGIEIQSLLLVTTNSAEEKMPFSAYFALSIGVPIGILAMIVVLYKDIQMVSDFIAKFGGGSLTELLVFLLAAFWIWDMLWHISVRKTMRSMIDASKERMQGKTKKYVEQEQLVFFEGFIFGGWRFLRIYFGLIVIRMLIFISIFFDDVIIMPILNYMFNVDGVLAILIFGFVVISEAWIWIMRHRLIVGVKTIESLGKNTI
jgi:hypothetical protein